MSHFREWTDLLSECGGHSESHRLSQRSPVWIYLFRFVCSCRPLFAFRSGLGSLSCLTQLQTTSSPCTATVTLPSNFSRYIYTHIQVTLFPDVPAFCLTSALSLNLRRHSWSHNSVCSPALSALSLCSFVTFHRGHLLRKRARVYTTWQVRVSWLRLWWTLGLVIKWHQQHLSLSILSGDMSKKMVDLSVTLTFDLESSKVNHA